MQERYSDAPEPPTQHISGEMRYLEELFGHIGTATLVDDVGAGEEDLERDDEEDEEAHARSRGSDG